MAKRVRASASPAGVASGESASPWMQIQSLSWEELEHALRAPRARGKRAPGADQATLREYFGAQEYEHLCQLARQTALVRSRRGPSGNVVFLHGITGSDLGAVDGKNKTKDIWIDFFQILRGAVEKLQLQPDGSDRPNADARVVATGLNKRYYAKAILKLRAHWNVEPYAYDWRKDIDQAADGLAALINAKFPGQPVHLVAHSMGGLVSRNFIRRHPKLWDSMRGGDAAQGGRLIMLGTPNYGSFAIPQVLTGTDRMVDLLATADLSHSLRELLAITNTFVGSYQMLPAPRMLSPALQALYRSETWGDVPGISQRHLDRAYNFHADLETQATMDPARMVYVAGCKRPTLCGLRVVAPGEFDYELTHDGDGRVPHRLGLLDKVPTYYVDEVHGDLARNEVVLAAVEELLTGGTTAVLGATPLRGVQRAAPSLREYRSALDRSLVQDVAALAERARALHTRAPGGDARALTDQALSGSIALPEKLLAEEALIRAALGSEARSSPARAALKPARVSAEPKHPLQLEIVQADITRIKAPMVVVGHYKGVSLVHAIGAIDARLNGWISRACDLGMFAGNLGETFYVPNVAQRLGAKGAVVAGMGEFGKFSAEDLMLLMSNVAIGASALGLESFASVLIGSGVGSLPREVALAAFLDGCADGLRRLHDEHGTAFKPIKRVTLVELNGSVYKSLVESAMQIASEDRLHYAHIQLLPTKAPNFTQSPAPVRGREQGEVRKLEEVRLTVEASEGKFRFSALEESAVVPVREVDVNTTYAVQAAERLKNSGTREEQQQFGEFLFTYLVPQDFQPLLESQKPLRLILDRATAAYPWEMASYPGGRLAGATTTLGLDLGVTRQFRTLLSGAPRLRPPLNRNIKALVIADPAPEPHLQLPGARREGRAVVNALRAHNGANLSVQVTERIGHAECDPVEILALLLSGQFDIVHFAGHGDFDQAHPERGGWILSEKNMITAADIFRARQVPRLVFANACFSADIKQGVALGVDEMSRALASIAQAFFERGVVNYIGSGWPVDDMQATQFAAHFYDMALSARTIGAAVTSARRSIADYGSTWGAYQHYGGAEDYLVTPAAMAARARR